jgi:hypothetical protein
MSVLRSADRVQELDRTVNATGAASDMRKQCLVQRTTERISDVFGGDIPLNYPDLRVNVTIQFPKRRTAALSGIDHVGT